MGVRLNKPCRTPRYKDRRLLIRIARRALDLSGAAAADKRQIDIILASSALIQRLNESFLKHRGDTDVIAFDYADSDDPAPGRSEEDRLAAEIYICLPVAERAAKEYGTSVSFEVILYIIHGLLHLAGFDDHSDEERRQMRRQEQILLSAIDQEFGTVDVFQN